MNDKLPLYERLRQDVEPYYDTEIEIPKEAQHAFDLAMARWIRADIHGLWFEPDGGDGHSAESLAYRIAERQGQLVNAYNGQPTQSPIEDMLLGALLWNEADWAGFPDFDILGEGPLGQFYLKAEREPLRMHYVLTPQMPIAGHRVDFLLWVTCGKAEGGIAIECDGHAFHEKTKEQAARDKKRDREILAAGYPVMRFAGSEVFANSGDCAAQIKEVFSETLNRVSKEGGLF